MRGKQRGAFRRSTVHFPLLINLDDLEKKEIKPTSNEDEQAEIKALPSIDSSADLIEIDDIEVDENDTLDEDSIFFLLIYHLCKGF